MEIISTNGMVEFTLIAGKDMVKGRMLESEALELIRKGSIKQKGNKITVDGKFIFETGEGEVEEKPLVESVKPQEEPQEDKPLTKKSKDDKPLSKNSKRKPKKK